MNRFTTGEHTGTHVDAPSHFVQGQKSVDALTLNQLSGPLSVIDLTRKSAADSNAVLTVEDISIAEQKHGAITANGFVVIRTGWGERWKDPVRYANADPKGVLHFPGVSVEAARFLLKQRQARGIGIDTLSCDPGNSTGFEEHHAVLGAGKVNLENLANLDQIPVRGAWLFAAGLPVRNGTGAPARVFALVPDPQPSH